LKQFNSVQSISESKGGNYNMNHPLYRFYNPNLSNDDENISDVQDNEKVASIVNNSSKNGIMVEPAIKSDVNVRIMSIRHRRHSTDKGTVYQNGSRLYTGPPLDEDILSLIEVANDTEFQNPQYSLNSQNSKVVDYSMPLIDSQYSIKKIEGNDLINSNELCIQSVTNYPKKYNNLDLVHKITLDSNLLDKKQDIKTIDTSTQQYLGASFGKAATGRLFSVKNTKLVQIPEKDVMLVGLKLQTQKKVPKRIITQKDIITPIAQCSPSKDSVDVTVMIEPIKKDEPIEQLDEEPKLIENEIEDLGVYRQIEDVDAVISHYKSCLETRKKNIRLGVRACEPLVVFKEVPDFFPEKVEPLILEKNHETKQVEKVESIPEQMKNMDEKSVENKGGRNSRPKSTAGDKEDTASSNCTCSCTTRSCSFCLSRTTSAQTQRSKSINYSTDYTKMIKRPSSSPQLAINYAEFNQIEPFNIPLEISLRGTPDYESDNSLELEKTELEEIPSSTKLKVNVLFI
jgi:hypothetical protein